MSQYTATPGGLTRRHWLGSGAAIAALMADASATPAQAAPGEPPPDVYRNIGVDPFINCTATVTINGGSRLLPEVIEGIEHASHYHVNLNQLIEAAGKRISTLLEVPWAMVSSGAAAALAHASAACVAGSDPERMQQLPDTTGLKSEAIIPRSSRNQYDHAVRMVGLKTIEVDSAEELRAALNHRTALVMLLGNRFEDVRLPLAEVAPIANAAGVPVLVDAAPDYPIIPNPYLALGADLVAYSGGKILRGPQTAGLLLGREDLVRAAVANSAPHHGFGRPMKVSKEEIVGMVTAVDVWVNKRDIKAEYAEWEGWYRHIIDVLAPIDGLRAEIQPPSRGGPFPILYLSWAPEKIGFTASEVHDRLLHGAPSIQTHAAGDGHGFRFRPVAMKPGEYEIAAQRLKEVFSDAPKPSHQALSSPIEDVAGQWDMHIDFPLGKADHLVFFETRENRLSGTHIGSLARGPIQGLIDGDELRFQSVLPLEGAKLSYSFRGKLSNGGLSGEIDLGEYPKAQWTAVRRSFTRALPTDPSKAGKTD